MIIAFETEPSEKLTKFLNNWKNPSNVAGIISNSTYVEFDITTLDNITIISQKSLLDVYAKIGLFFSIATLLVSYVLRWSVFLNIAFVIMMFCIFWLSKYFRFYWFVWLQLKRVGHKPKIKYAEDNYIISKLLNEVQNGIQRHT